MQKILSRWLYRCQILWHSFWGLPFLVPYWKKEEWREAFRLLLTGKLVQGHAQETLYSLLTDRLGPRAMLFTSQGRTALSLALDALGVKAGDEILLPSFLCGSVAKAVLGQGAIPVWVDVKEDFTLDPESLKKNISSKSRGIIMVHAGGKVADADEISAIAERNGLFVIDDAAQALGALWKGRPAGTLGVCGILSFGQGKNAMATAGGVLLLNEQAERSLLRSKLSASEPWCTVFGRLCHRLFFHRLRRWTMPLALVKEFFQKPRADLRPHDPLFRMSNMDASLACLQIKRLEEILTRCKDNALLLRELLADVPEIRFPDPKQHVFTKCWVVLDKDRPSSSDYWGEKALGLAKHLLRQGIEVEWPYVPLHLRREMPGVLRSPLPITESLWWRTLALPVHPLLEPKDMERISKVIKGFFARKASSQRSEAHET